MILAGDIGGTSTRLAPFEEGGALAPARSETFPSREHETLAAVVRTFRDKGRFRPWLEKVPVRVVLDERAPLLGAARYPLREMAG